MLFLKQTRDYKYALMTTGGATLYDSSGALEKEDVELSPDITSGAQRVNGISVISYSGGTGEIAIEGNDGMKKYTTSEDMNVLTTNLLINTNKFICHLTSKGKINNVRYRQNIFIYPDYTDCLGLVKSLVTTLKEV